MLCTYDKYRSILGHPSFCINDSLPSTEHSLTQHVEALGSALGITSFLFQHLFFPFFFKFSQTKKGSCAQNTHFEILFRVVIKFLSFHYRKLVKIPVFSSSSRIFYVWPNVSPKRIKLDFWLRPFERAWNSLSSFLIFPFTKLIKSTV